jgi:hypothetical protein
MVGNETGRDAARSGRSGGGDDIRLSGPTVRHDKLPARSVDLVADDGPTIPRILRLGA